MKRAREVYREYDDVSFETTFPQRFDHWELQPQNPRERISPSNQPGPVWLSAA